MQMWLSRLQLAGDLLLSWVMCQ